MLKHPHKEGAKASQILRWEALPSYMWQDTNERKDFRDRVHWCRKEFTILGRLDWFHGTIRQSNKISNVGDCRPTSLKNMLLDFHRLVFHTTQCLSGTLLQLQNPYATRDLCTATCSGSTNKKSQLQQEISGWPFAPNSYPWQNREQTNRHTDR